MMYSKEYNVRQSSEKDSSRKDYYKWAVWIENGGSDISDIDYVQYLLHSTFKNRFRKISEVSTGFRMKSSGWGEFKIEISVTKKSGESIQMSHWLNLKNDFQDTDEVNKESELNSKKLYISHSDADIRKAQYLQIMLTDLGMDVVSTSDVELGASLKDYITESINSSDAVISINSETGSDWQKAEIKIANELDKTVIPMESFINIKKKNSNFSSISGTDRSYTENLKDLGDKIKKIKF
ncbi:MAG: hypothetical protein COA50_11715 [Flavobacteriaceae bacterium]|nr:MAG: hypothetical protein COA50_11715 [Flavobacteriaceae bacterium]